MIRGVVDTQPGHGERRVLVGGDALDAFARLTHGGVGGPGVHVEDGNAHACEAVSRAIMRTWASCMRM